MLNFLPKGSHLNRNTITLSIVNAVDTFGVGTYFFSEIFSGDCSGLNHSFCSAWNYSSASIGFGDLVPGNTYFIRVSNPYNQVFHFDICLGTLPPPPANDACTGAVALNVDPDADCDAPISGNTTGASASPLPVCYNCVAMRGGEKGAKRRHICSPTHQKTGTGAKHSNICN